MIQTNEPGAAGQEWSASVAALVAALPAWLETRRWFADKGRAITAVEMENALVETVDDDRLLLGIARVTFRDGDVARYLLPLAWTERVGEIAVITPATFGNVAGGFIEAVDAPWFGRWLLGAMTGVSGWSENDWIFTPHPPAREILATARNLPATIMRAEQSNTSLRYGDVLMVKLVRRLQSGPNPDEEMLRALAAVGFNRVPPYAGGASWRSGDGETYPIALAQAFVPNLGDGWSWMLDRLRELPESAFRTGLDERSPEWLLGRRTAELHVALAQVNNPGYAPEPASAAAIELDIRRVQNAVDQTVSLLKDADLPQSLHASLPAIVDGLRGASLRAAGLQAEAGTQRIRVHGDYHLGQTLRTPDDDWIIIDFEGEPARPVFERRQKTSALKDVSGMLRSFAYARGAAEREYPVPAREPNRARLSAWEFAARRAFLAGYRDVIRDAPVPLVPAADEAFLAALAAWELDKALYEIAYEVRNRPHWVELSLRSLLAHTSY